MYKKGKRSAVPRRVVGLRDQRFEIMREVHDAIGHRGRGATFDQVKRRYQWKGMFSDIDEWVKIL